MNSDPIGTKLSGYAPPSMGPFECEHCAHFTAPHFCGHPKVIEDAKAGELKVGKKDRAVVAAKGCCNFYRPVEA